MKNSNPIWDKIFLGFGIITIISGAFLVLENDYLIGISGSIVGVWLVVSNLKNLKNRKGD
jgi:hypothetical protein